MIALVSFLSFIYLAALVVILIAWNKPKKNHRVNSKNDLISIVVAFRNEEKYLQETIYGILGQLGGGNFELIAINDHSTDNSLAIAKNLELTHEKLSVYSLTDKFGKKAAVELGVKNSKGTIILQTDADCKVPSSWLSCMRRNFLDDCHLLVGPVAAIATNNTWNWLNQLEMLCLQAITFTSIHYKNPTMANGANLMFRKQDFLAYLDSGIGAGFASGDDQHLLDFLKKNSAKVIRYVKEREAIVSSHFPDEWNNMVQQRSRWASKNKNAKNSSTVVGLLFLSIQLLFPVLLTLSLINRNYSYYAWDFLLTKCLIEFILLFFINQFFSTKSIKYSPLFSIVYPFFICAILLNFRQKKEWKNRTI